MRCPALQRTQNGQSQGDAREMTELARTRKKKVHVLEKGKKQEIGAH